MSVCHGSSFAVFVFVVVCSSSFATIATTTAAAIAAQSNRRLQISISSESGSEMADYLAEELDDAYFDELEEDLKRIMNSEDDPEAEEVLRERALEEQAEQCSLDLSQDSDGHWHECARSPISQRMPSLTRSEMDGILESMADMSQGGGGGGCDSVVIFPRLIDDLLMILNGQLATDMEELVALREHGKDIELKFQ